MRKKRTIHSPTRKHGPVRRSLWPNIKPYSRRRKNNHFPKENTGICRRDDGRTVPAAFLSGGKVPATVAFAVDSPDSVPGPRSDPNPGKYDEKSPVKYSLCNDSFHCSGKQANNFIMARTINARGPA
jgi:hypothetical protein